MLAEVALNAWAKANISMAGFTPDEKRKAGRRVCDSEYCILGYLLSGSPIIKPGEFRRAIFL
jgi:hypothetical protein